MGNAILAKYVGKEIMRMIEPQRSVVERRRVVIIMPHNLGKEAKGGVSTTCVNVAIEKYTKG